MRICPRCNQAKHKFRKNSKCCVVCAKQRAACQFTSWDYSDTAKKIIDNSTIADNDCLVFNGGKHSQGYGLICISKKKFFTHRIVAAHYYDVLMSRDIVVMHTCDNPPCCNPQHLKIGTQLDNVQDSIAKGRHDLGRSAKRAYTTLRQRVVDLQSRCKDLEKRNKELEQIIIQMQQYTPAQAGQESE